jgi:hypothetical protein
MKQNKLSCFFSILIVFCILSGSTAIQAQEAILGSEARREAGKMPRV